MLFAGRERQRKSAVAVLVVSNTAKPSGHLADELVLSRKYTDMRPTETHWNSERLALADNNVCSARTGRLKQAKRNRLGNNDNEQSTHRMSRISQRFQIFYAPKEIRRLHD